MKQHCPKCGKFMRREMKRKVLFIYITEWRCRCGQWKRKLGR